GARSLERTSVAKRRLRARPSARCSLALRACPARCIRSHESIAEDPVVLVLDPLSFESTLTEHRERLLAGGEVLENLVDAPVVEGAPLIGVAVGVPSADRGVARGAARPHVAVVEHHDPCTGL